MAGVNFFNAHRSWEDWAGVAIGFLIGLTPWLADGVDSTLAVQLTMLIGIGVLVFSAFEFVDLHRWEETALVILGAALILMPFLFGYAASGSLRIWHFVLGALTVAMGLLELWQDWRLSDKQLARHGE